MSKNATTSKKASWISRTATYIKDRGEYLWTGIWSDRRTTFKVRLLKTVNLSVRTLVNPALQTRAYALTFNTLLSIVPVVALLLAVGKGFGLQDLLTQEILNLFPSQRQVADILMELVNSYLSSTGRGVFVGIGILFLLYTVITLMSAIEDNFNRIWGVVDDRSLYQKLVDYLAVCLLVPIMLICSIGITVFMNQTFQNHFDLPILSPIIDIVLDFAPFMLVCLAFIFSFYWIPHAKVKLKYAVIAGLICGIAFQLLQLIFINGQIMVANYNAIYGSFSFIPLFLLWLWISWLIVLTGVVITYSAQYVFCFPFTESIDNISNNYYQKILTVVTAIIADRHLRNETPLSVGEISVKYVIPIRLVNRAVRHLSEAGLIYYVAMPGRSEFDSGMVPAMDLGNFTVADLMKRLDEYGRKDFIPEFDAKFSKIEATIESIKEEEYKFASTTLLREIAQSLPSV